MVHDKLWQWGGGERVALALRETWPGADLYTSTFDQNLVDSHGLEGVKATRLQRVPALSRAHSYFLPLYDRAFRGLDFGDYDLVVSSSAMFAKSVRPAPEAPHLCYCHTPPRFLWDLRDELIAELPRSRATKTLVRGLSGYLRRVDLRAADGVDRWVANSAHVARRIRDYYDQDADVVYPPVDIHRPLLGAEQGEYALVLARLYPYKRVDLAIEACNALRLPLEIVGEGSDRPRLEALAGPTVRFRGWVSEGEKNRLVEGARVLIAPQVEDFGIATVEAIAAGTPVLALRAGGATEIVYEEINGSFFEEQSAASLTAALRSFDESRFERDGMRRSVERFAPENFTRSMLAVSDELLTGAS